MGLADQVAAEHQFGDGCLLDGRGLLVADVAEGLQQFGAKAKAREAGGLGLGIGLSSWFGAGFAGCCAGFASNLGGAAGRLGGVDYGKGLASFGGLKGPWVGFLCLRVAIDGMERVAIGRWARLAVDCAAETAAG